MGELIAVACEPAFAGQANAIGTRPRLDVARRGADEVHLSLEFVESTEGVGIEHLHEHCAAPAFGRIGAAVAGESCGQRLD